MSTTGYSNSSEQGPQGEEPIHPGAAQAGAATIDPEALRAAKAEIEGLRREVAVLSRRDVPAEQFYEKLLNNAVQALAASGGAIWILGDGGALRLKYQINFRETGLGDSANPVAQMQHARMLSQVLTEDEATLVAPHSGRGEAVEGDENSAANPTDFLLILAPVANDQGPQGVLEIFQRPGARSATQKGYLRYIQHLCVYAGDYLKSQRLKQFADKQSLWEQLETFTRTAHESLDSRQSAFTIANEGRRLIGCDRVSVAIKKGGRCRIQAVSGQDTFDKRSNVITMLGRLADAVTKTGEDVWYSGDTSDLAPQVEDTLDAYVDESHAKAIAVLPLAKPRDEEEMRAEEEHVKPPKYFGAIIVEQMVDSQTPEGLAQRVDVVRQHSARSLSNALEHEGVFLMPVWKTIGKSRVLVSAKNLPKTVLALAAITGLVCFLTFYQTDFSLEARGQLRPEIRRNVFAGIGGQVEDVLVEHSQPVTQGQVLLKLNNRELEKSWVVIGGQKQAIIKQMTSAQQAAVEASKAGNRLQEAEWQGRLVELEAEFNTLIEQEKLLQQQRDMLEVRSPIDGMVTTWQPREKLEDATVSAEQRLITVAKTNGEWELELLMPENRMNHIVEAHQQRSAGEEGPLPVTFILATQPDVEHEGFVSEIAETAEVHGDEGNTVKIRVSFDQGLLETEAFAGMRPGAAVTAKVHCGTESIGYVWLHDLVGWVQSKVIFTFLR